MSVDVMLPGPTQPQSSGGVLGPQDVPAWMTRGGSAPRAASQAVGDAAALLRRTGGLVRSVTDASTTAMSWSGTAARTAQDKVARLAEHLTSTARELDDVHDALAALAVALDTWEPTLSSGAMAWSHAVTSEQRVQVLRQWQPAVAALHAADQRAATALDLPISTVERLRAKNDGGNATVQIVVDPSPEGPVESAVGAAGNAGAAVINGVASWLNAAGHHPASAGEVIAGVALMVLGGTGEVAGFALDATGIGAIIGVPANAVSAGVALTGVALATPAAADLAMHAMSDNHVDPAGSGPGEGASAPTGSSTGAGAVEEVLGNLPKGRQTNVRVVGSDAELQALYDELAESGTPLDVPTYRGTWVMRPDGIRVGIRDASKSGGRTIDIETPDISDPRKVHVDDYVG
jgi:uncharacterized protein YukE